MSRALTHGEIKALVRQLVKAVGGTEASARELNCTHQWVSDLQNVNKPCLPDFQQIIALEVIAQSPIVTGAAARAITGEEVNEVAAAVVAAVGAGATTLRLVHDMDSDGRRDAGEIRNVQSAARENLEQAQRAFSAASRLTPTGLEA